MLVLTSDIYQATGQASYANILTKPQRIVCLQKKGGKGAKKPAPDVKKPVVGSKKPAAGAKKPAGTKGGPPKPKKYKVAPAPLAKKQVKKPKKIPLKKQKNPLFIPRPKNYSIGMFFFSVLRNSKLLHFLYKFIK